MTYEPNGSVLHFCSRHTDDENKVHHEWFSLLLRDDFFRCLKELGRIPPTTTKDYFEEIKKANEYTKLLDRATATPEGVILQQRLDDKQAENQQIYK